jgi:predicted small secreted protein
MLKNLKMITVCVALLLCAGCNTIGGFGQDISQTGQAIDNAAGWSQEQINTAADEAE